MRNMSLRSCEGIMYLQRGILERITMFFFYTQKDDSLYQLSISSDGLYAVDPYLQEALKRRIKSLSQQTYAS